MKWCMRCLREGPVRDCNGCDRRAVVEDIQLEPVVAKRVRPRIVRRDECQNQPT